MALIIDTVNGIVLYNPIVLHLFNHIDIVQLQPH